MTANINLGSVALASDGKTLTATISGGSGSGYAITSAVGLIPHLSTGDTEAFYIASVSVSSTTLTMVLGSSVGSSETLKLDITTSSNLTDSSSNTPTGQTNLAVTNSSTVTVTTILVSSSPGSFELNGLFPTSATKLRSSNTFLDSTLSDDRAIEFVADATEVSFLGYVGSTSTVRVDGATSDSTPTQNPGGFWVVKGLSSGLTGKHLYRVNSGDYFNGVRLVGGARTLTSVATTKAPIIAQSVAMMNMTQTTSVALWGTRNPASAGSGSTQAVTSGQFYNSLIAEFGHNGSSVEMCTVGISGSFWSVSSDGAYPGALTSTGVLSNQQGLVVLAKGLAAGTSHTFSAMFTSCGTNTTHYFVKILKGTATTATATAGSLTIQVADTTNLKAFDWIKIDGSGNREFRQIASGGITGSVVTLTAALTNTHASGAAVVSYEAAAATISANTRSRTAKRLVGLGDSNTQGANDYGGGSTPDSNGTYYSTYDPRSWPGFLVADSQNYEIINLGIQGQTTAQIAARTPDLATYGQGAYDYVTIWAGTNDINATGSSYTPTQYNTDVQTMITAAKVYLRTGGKVVLMPPETPQGGPGTAGGLTIATATAQLTALAAADPSHVLFASDLVNDLVSGDYNGVHYHLAGQQKMSLRLAPYIGITPAPIAVAPLPVLSGTAVVRGTIATTTGSWLNSPTSYTYQWQRDGTNISGATSATYAPVLADVTHTITCLVSGVNSYGTGSPAGSNGLVVANPLAGLYAGATKVA